MSNHSKKCLVCGAENSEFWARTRDLEYYSSDETFDFLRCQACGVLFIDPVPRDRLSEIYPKNYYAFDSQKKSFVQSVKARLDARVFRKILKQLPGEKLALLDVGGGSGWQLDAIRRVDPRVTFTQIVDLDSHAMELARASGHEFFNGRIEDFRTERTFDLILMLNLIEHVENPLEILRKTSAMLSPAGLLLVQTPNFASLDARLFRHRNWGGFHSPRHWVLFDKPSFLATADKAGLKLRQFKYTQGAPFWANSVLFQMARWHVTTISKTKPAYTNRWYPLLAAGFAGFDFLRAPVSKLSQMFIVLARK